MSDTFKVTKVKSAGEKDNPHGGKLFKFYVSLTDSAGAESSDVYWQRKSDSLNEGEEFYGDITKGEYGLRFKTAQRPDSGSGGGSGRAAQNDLPPEFWAMKDKRIGRAGIVQAIVTGSPLPPESAPQPESLENYLNYVDLVADALIARLDQHAPSPNGADVGGGTDKRSGSAAGISDVKAVEHAAADVSATGFASDPQREHFERQLKLTPATPETIGTISLYAATLPTQQVSAQMDLLVAEATRLPIAKKLAAEAAEWAKGQSDIPGDQTGLGEPMAVGAADDGIPF